MAHFGKPIASTELVVLATPALISTTDEPPLKSSSAISTFHPGQPTPWDRYRSAAAPDSAAHSDPPGRAMGRRWLAVVVATLVAGAYAGQVVVPAAETSPAPILGIAPSYGPKSVSAVPNAAGILRRIWLPELDAGCDPQGLAVDDGVIDVSAYRSDSLGVRRGPCRVIRIDLETGGSTGHVDVPSPCGHAGGLAVGGDGILYVAGARSIGSTLLPERRSAAMKSRLVPRASPSAMPADCGR